MCFAIRAACLEHRLPIGKDFSRDRRLQLVGSDFRAIELQLRKNIGFLTIYA